MGLKALSLAELKRFQVITNIIQANKMEKEFAQIIIIIKSKVMMFKKGEHVQKHPIFIVFEISVGHYFSV